MTYIANPIKIILEDKLRIACTNRSRGVYEGEKDSASGCIGGDRGSGGVYTGRDRDSEEWYISREEIGRRSGVPQTAVDEKSTVNITIWPLHLHPPS